MEKVEKHDMEYRKKIMELLGEKNYEPMTYEELIEFFMLNGKEVGLFLTELDQMEQDGLLFCTKKGKYLLPEKMQMVIGILSKHKKGFGFVQPASGEGEDVFIAPDNLKLAMHGDLVAVKLLSAEESDRRREGIVTRIMKHNNSELVGTFSLQKRFGFVVPDDPKQKDDIFVPQRGISGAATGDRVVVKITVWPEKDKKAEGVITEIISKRGESGGDMKALIRQYGLSQEFPQIVQAEAEATEKFIQKIPAERRDLRGKKIITIDGADSKDFDDAVSVDRLANGNYLLGVHIADVTNYVKEGRPIDKEALKRGNSVYLIDQVVPMLPKELSNGICSLNPKEDRYTLSVDMEVDPQGNVVNHDIYESVIQSKERMVYTDVSDMLEEPEEAHSKELFERYKETKEDLLQMQELAILLRQKRELRGTVDFDLDEAYIHLNEDGIPVSISTAERRTANKMIEEFMLLANETVAEHFYWMEVPFIYRVHEKPSAEKLEELKRFLFSFHLKLKGNPESIHPKALNEILKEAEGLPEEHVINTVTLRSMKKAFYGPDCEGHFGLGVKYYCHFTSPIRRYPDLMIHRIIKECLHGDLTAKRAEALTGKVKEASEISCVTERKAQELEREAEKLKMAEYMTYHIGEIHSGVISGVANFGFFVEIENTVEGLVRVAELHDDFYDYEPEKYRLFGRRLHRTYTLGDKVKILVKRADVQNREIDFAVLGEDGKDEEEATKKPKVRGAKKK